MKKMLRFMDDSAHVEQRELYWIDADNVRHVGANPYMHGDCSKLYGDCTGLTEDCSGLSGDCTGVYGGCLGFSGNFDKCELDGSKVYIDELIGN